MPSGATCNYFINNCLLGGFHDSQLNEITSAPEKPEVVKRDNPLCLISLLVISLLISEVIRDYLWLHEYIRLYIEKL